MFYFITLCTLTAGYGEVFSISGISELKTWQVYGVYLLTL